MDLNNYHSRSSFTHSCRSFGPYLKYNSFYHPFKILHSWREVSKFHGVVLGEPILGLFSAQLASLILQKLKIFSIMSFCICFAPIKFGWASVIAFRFSLLVAPVPFASTSNLLAQVCRRPFSFTDLRSKSSFAKQNCYAKHSNNPKRVVLLCKTCNLLANCLICLQICYYYNSYELGGALPRCKLACLLAVRSPVLRGKYSL